MSLSLLIFTLFEPKIPLMKALTIVYRPIKLLTGYHQRPGLHGQDQQGGPNEPKYGDQAAGGHVFCYFSANISISLSDTIYLTFLGRKKASMVENLILVLNLPTYFMVKAF